MKKPGHYRLIEHSSSSKTPSTACCNKEPLAGATLSDGIQILVSHGHRDCLTPTKLGWPQTTLVLPASIFFPLEISTLGGVKAQRRSRWMLLHWGDIDGLGSWWGAAWSHGEGPGGERVGNIRIHPIAAGGFWG